MVATAKKENGRKNEDEEKENEDERKHEEDEGWRAIHTAFA